MRNRLRRRFSVHGLVQGVGFRPFVYALASELALTGSVANTSAGVLIEVEGTAGALSDFGLRLRSDAPSLAVVEDVIETGIVPHGGTGFTIDDTVDDGRARTLASPDVATCEACLAELSDPANRRYRHPFITCTNCGPRYTVITEMPYDRVNTTMADFQMCDACRTEYTDPDDRRFHAQPIACHDCGPVLELVGTDTKASIHGWAALKSTRALLSAGRIVAIKGLGGYHLACDARNSAAVAELRRRKHRGGKPFAIMVVDVDVARSLVMMTTDEEHLLGGIRKPIVVLPRRASLPHRPIADAVAPGNPDVGVMLPYTAIHTLLFGLAADEPGPDALVMTSGNLSGEVIVADDDEALDKLGRLADAWLRHDRRIEIACDDSVTSFVGGKELPIRRSRGYAPLPIALPFEVAPSLAAGADLKNTCAIAGGHYAWVSQHLGDMDDLATIEALARTEQHLELMTGVKPQHIIADQHPGYRSSGWARTHANGTPVQTVQHHHAHIASVLGENGAGPDESAIGFAFDGTGYGSDGAVWGGEVLIANYKSFRRAAHLRYVPLAGGNASVSRPYRMALSYLSAAAVAWDERLPPVQACPSDEQRVLAGQFASGYGTVPTSSMGRLFDAVASLVGLRHYADYEAEAAIALEGTARLAQDHPLAVSCAYAFGIERETTDEPIIADAGPVIRAIAADVLMGEQVANIAAGFHRAVTTLIVDLAEICREQTGLSIVALGGGVFQNRLLLGASELVLAEHGFTVLRPRLLPPNDGGLALGQILVGASN